MLFLWIVPILPVQAQEAGSSIQQKLGGLKESPEPVYINAEEFDYKAQEKLYIGRGKVDVHYADMRLRADELNYYQETGQLLAQGRVILEQGENRLTGDRLEMNLDTRQGVLYQGEGFMAPSHYFSGEEIRLTGENEFEIIQGNYSACDQEVPDWRFHVQQGTLKLEQFARLKNFTIYIRRYPVFWFPYIILPVRTKRTTGLLLPQAGYSDLNGAYLKNKFFWDIAPWMDATLALDYFDKRGIGTGLEFRYAITDVDGAKLDTYYIDDHVQDETRWRLDLDLKQHFDPGFYTGTQLDMLSDNQFDRQLAGDIAQRRRQVKDSYVWLTKNWDAYSASLLGEYVVDLYQAEPVKLWRQPELELFAVSQPAWRTPLWFRLDASAVSLRREDPDVQETDRLAVQPQVFLPLELPYGMTFTPQAGYQERWYDENVAGHTEAIGNYELGGRLEGPAFSRIFSVSAWGVEAVKHAFNPYLVYSFVSNEDQDRLAYFDRLDRTPPQNLIVYGLENHFWSKSSQGLVREWLSFSLNQAYDIRERRRGDKDQALSPLKWQLDFRPVDFLDLGAEISYNFHEDKWQTLNFDAELRREGLGRINLGWRYTDFPRFSQTNLSFIHNLQPAVQNNPYTFWYTPSELTDINFLHADGELELSERWFAGAGVNYNLEEQEIVENRYRLEYRSQCWGLIFSYINRFDDNEFTVNLSLKTLGSVGSL